MQFPSYIELHFLMPALIRFLSVKFYFIIVLFHFRFFYFPFLIYYKDSKDLHYSKVIINVNELDINCFIQKSVRLVEILD